MGQTSSAPDDPKEFDGDGSSTLDEEDDSLVECSSFRSETSLSPSEVNPEATEVEESADASEDIKETIEESYITASSLWKIKESTIPGNRNKSNSTSRMLLKPSTPEQWKSTFGSLTDDELILLLNPKEEEEKPYDLTPLGVEIKKMATKIKEYQSFMAMISKSSSSNNENDNAERMNTNQQTSSTVCFYKTKKQGAGFNLHQENSNSDDTALIALCVRILKASSDHGKQFGGDRRKFHKKFVKEHPKQKPPIVTLSRLRLKLVPSKLKEHVFWESLWMILHERHEQLCQHEFWKEVGETSHKALSSLEREKEEEKERELAPHIRIALLEEQLRCAWDHISDLTEMHQSQAKSKEISDELLEGLWKITDKESFQSKRTTSAPCVSSSTTNNGKHHRQNSSMSSLPCVRISENKLNESVDNETDDDKNDDETQLQDINSTTKKQHPGSWKMSKDSLEFLEFPTEAKEALRTEKQKRLKRVREEMAFILDSDDPKDSKGEWTCCHKTNYNDDCGCP